MDSLDAALLRPGRIDRKVEYKLATKPQASALFDRFYPPKHVTPESLQNHPPSEEKPATEATKIAVLAQLNDEFTASVPEHEFSTAELQGYLLSCKMMPEKAAKGVKQWVEDERKQREEKEMRIESKKRKQAERMEKMEVEKFQKTLAKMNGGSGMGPGPMGMNGDVTGIPPPPTVAKSVNGGSGFVVPPPTVGKQVNGVNGTAVVEGDSAEAAVNGVRDSQEVVN